MVRCSGEASCSGFSLIELLVTMVLILIITTLYWSPSSGNRQRALQRVCAKNLETIHIALQIYANDHGGKFPETAGARNSEEALEPLVPRYTSDTATFICPGSKDSSLSGAQSLLRHKISYAYYMGCYLTNSQQALMSDKQVDTKAKAAGQPLFSSTGKPPGNNHRKYGGNVLFCDGHVELSPPKAAFPLPLGPGEVLLNP